jgi:hypothetical protein
MGFICDTIFVISAKIEEIYFEYSYITGEALKLCDT